MSSPNYRVHVSFDGERKVFVARVPELPACLGEGATRSEALINMERELEALVANFADRGARPPVAADDEAVSGELQLQVSRSLHRELLFAARAEGVELGQLVSELVAAGLEHRQRRSGRRPEWLRRPAPVTVSSARPSPRDSPGHRFAYSRACRVRP
jgi:predicted RNase H-like HicB family nuclease